eukprot:gene1346-18537_t
MVWHEHVLDTAAYRRDCARHFGRFLDRAPSFGGKEEKVEMLDQQRAMLERYQAAFGRARDDVWPRVERVEAERGRAGGDNVTLPDCCSFNCVKP